MTILAPLRGVTTRLFRETFANEISGAGFDEAVTPFISAMHGVDPLADRELAGGAQSGNVKVTPQFIGKDPASLRRCLERIKTAGFDTADLNCGCPFPMVRNKGRGSGILKTPDVLHRMLEVGCETMGAGKFSVKARIGVDRPDELLGLVPLLNEYPLRFLAVHPRTARQMYSGECDMAAFEAVAAAAKMPIVRNGDVPMSAIGEGREHVMIGRAFLRDLGARPDSRELLGRYAAALRKELYGARPVLGAIKELVSYWKETAPWSRLWNVLKLCRTLDELGSVLPFAL
jgi:tRNA-dihydrouridine synthase